MEIVSLTGETEEEVSQELEEAVETVEALESPSDSDNSSSSSKSTTATLVTSKQAALVVEGTSLTHAMAEKNEDKLLKLAGLCSSVLCVRATPLQKAELVKLVRTNLDVVTLAIGDGANDTSMLREAHIGVGINGVEGNQAILASDYAIGQFKYPFIHFTTKK